ncbi:MAG: hypothetical protein V4592_25420 [Bacteroidota bacterium]
MKTFILIFIHLASAIVLFVGSCSHSAKSKLKGEWKSKDGTTKLNISADKFTEDNGSPVTEDYFMKGDTIYTSFEGNQPFTKFVVLNVDDHNLKLLYPDSVSIAFVR